MEQPISYELLNKIDSPEDLRHLPIESLPEVCKELRDKIIDELSRNPGHFGSSLGVIELTVALHYIFNTPYDRIVWDVGHQAYGHKILTGRRDRFCTNRKLNGLCPFAVIVTSLSSIVLSLPITGKSRSCSLLWCDSSTIG